jgi:hypothetical protein
VLSKRNKELKGVGKKKRRRSRVSFDMEFYGEEFWDACEWLFRMLFAACR